MSDDESTSSWKETITRVCIIPQRYVLGIMGFLAVANAYAMRGCLSLAITEMVVNPKAKHGEVIEDPNACPGVLEHSNHTDPSNEFDWDEQTQGLILSAFYWGYVLTHIPGGLLAQRFGGKQTVGLGILGTAVLTLLTPAAARAGPKWMIAVRFLEGLGEGTTFPGLNQLLAQWAPPLERGRLGSLVFAGNQIGIVVSSSLSGVLLKYYSWPIIFYLFGIVAVIWFIMWSFLCFNDPASHPYITQKEKDYLLETLGSIKRKAQFRVPWLAMATSVPLWALIIGQIGHDWGLFTIQTDLPKYMKSVMKFSIVQNGIFSSLPFLVMWFTAIGSGILSDYLLKKKVLSVTVVRKIFTTVASVGPALGVVLASYAGCDKVAAATLFTVGMAFMGFFYPSLKVNALDLSPNYAGTLMAIVNGLGAISGIITPTLIGYLTPNQTLIEWRTVFWISFIVIIATNIIFIVLGSGNVQPWNEPRDHDKEETVAWNANSENVKKGKPNVNNDEEKKI